MSVLAPSGPARAAGLRVPLRAVLSGLAAALLLAALYGRMMSYGLRSDETLFVAPAALLQDARMYHGFFYNHAPDSAWLFRGFYLLFEPLGLLGSARLAVFAAWLLLLAAAVGITWRLARSVPLALTCALALTACETLLTQAGMTATNNLLPLPFALLGPGLFCCATLGSGPRRGLLVLAGFCLSLAAGLKVSAVAFIPPVAAAAFFLPAAVPLRVRLAQVVLPLVLGGTAGALPLLWYLLSDPALFLAHVLKFHTGPHVAYWQAHAAEEPGLALGLGARLQLAYRVWFSGAALLLALLPACLFWAAARAPGRGQAAQTGGAGQIITVLAALALSAGLSLIPAPGFPQYYIPPLVCLPLLSALLWRRLAPEQRAGLMPLLGGVSLLCLALAAPRLGPGLVRLAEPDNFTAARIIRGGDAIRAALAEGNSPPGPIATFQPLYPLEAGLPVYPELATGSFAYRVVPYLDDGLRAQYRAAGPQDLAARFDAEPPAAFLLGYAPELEAEMRAYAGANGYRAVPVQDLSNRYGTGQLLLRPAPSPP